MGIYLLFLFIFVVFIFLHNNHLRVKFHTFLKKGFAPKRGKFGVYCYCGKQGSGKTYSVVEFLKYNSNDLPIYSNVHLKGLKYTYFNGFDKLLELRNKSNCIIVYDEIFTALTKSTKLSNDVLDFLSQMRKRQIIFFTTAQEWLEINMTLRRYCRYQIDCKMLKILNVGVLVKRFHDAEQMKWSNLDNEYIAPLIETTISKCIYDVADSYDTFEQIKT